MIEKKSGLIKNAGLILLLVSLFILDDILIYLLFKNIYDWEVDLIYFGFGATIVLILNLGLAFAVFKIMRKRPTTGQQGMIGKKGVVLKAKNGEYQVRVQGEIWKSESREKLKVGDKVEIDSMDGLRLLVRKY
ncbi:NfeD family protein [candidate division KSB1 bacterium]|nr:NfeD family protein [candidate division KSB1 bacterium]